MQSMGGGTLDSPRASSELASPTAAEPEVTYQSMLSFLEASNVRSLLKVALEHIALVGMIVPETSKQAQELSQSVGREVSRVVQEQRYLEQRFEQVVAQRAVLRTMPNKQKYKENERELAEIAQKLRVATQTLSRNLKDSPDVTENMAKIAKERITLSSLIATLVTEAETMGYERLVRTVKEVQEGESMRNELKAKERATTAAVRKLKTIIREEKETHEDAMSDSRKRLAILKDELKELKSTTTVQSRYREKEVVSTNACVSRMQHQRLGELEKESLKLRQRIEIEKRCNRMTKEFLGKKAKLMSDKIVEWSSKHEADTQAKDRDLEALKMRHQLDAQKMTEVEQKYQKAVAEKELRLAEEKRAKDQKIANQQGDETRERAAMKIQALFRGHKARAAMPGAGKKGKK